MQTCNRPPVITEINRKKGYSKVGTNVTINYLLSSTPSLPLVDGVASPSSYGVDDLHKGLPEGSADT